MQRHKLRDLRVLELSDCTSRLTLALVAIARGCTRKQTRDLLHQYDFRFTDTEYTQWRKAVYSASVLSDNTKSKTQAAVPDKTDTTLVDLRRKGITREDARRAYGLTFTDTDWTIAGEIIADA